MTLSPFEIDLMRRISSGEVNKEMCSKYNLKKASLEKYRNTIYKKLGAKNAPHAVALAIKQNLI